MKDWIKRIVRQALHIETAKSGQHPPGYDRQHDRIRALYANRRSFPATYDRPAYLRRPRTAMCD